MTDEQNVRDLIARWIGAINAHDLDGVLADHAEDVVMYDVPPPYRGVHGIDAYRETWPPFFEWLRSGAVFELDSLDVVIGDEVAFAYGLLRCGKPEDFEGKPDYRLRVTMGLCKVNGRWVVTHEHHSFPHD